MSTKSDPARGAFVVTPSDSTTIRARSLYIGGVGDVTVQTTDNDGSITFTAHPVGYMPVEVRKVLATGTTATNIIGLT